MAEWLYEQGIGENRAILVEDGAIVEAAIELPGALSPGTIVEGRLTAILVPGRRGIVRIGSEEALIEPLPSGLTEGQRLKVEIVREAIGEEGRPKSARCRLSDADPRPGPGLTERIGAFSRHDGTGADRFEQAGWSELLEEAASGEIAFPGGALRMNLTPAMTLFDVDGALAPAELAAAGAEAAGRAIRRLGISGSIGIDLPTLAGRAERQRPAAALDAVLPQPFERTAVNGFGFLQVVRRRERASLPELLRSDPIGAAARALLRKAERAGGAGERILTAAPAVIARIEANPAWIAELERRTGAPAILRAEKGLAISAGHAQSRFA
ncbi:MAG TPA: ribonuclease [Allosphingosinicella sp.]|nr:ribonuclease [Allosphingosinicella sp.]